MKGYTVLGGDEAGYTFVADMDVFNECAKLDARASTHSMVFMSESDEISSKLQQALQKLDPELRSVLEVKYQLGVAEGSDLAGDYTTGGPVANSKVAERLGTTVDSVEALEAVALRALYTSGRKTH